jgi:cytochrome P450
MLKFILQPIDYMEDYYQQFGDFWAIGNPEKPFVYVNHPQAIQEIFKAKPDAFRSGQGNGVLKYLLGEHSLTLLDGSPHQRQRKLLMPPFHGEKLQHYQVLIEEITQETIQSWQIGKTFKVRSVMQEITLKVILKVVFGLKSGERYHQIITFLTNLLEGTSSRLGSSLLFFEFLRQDWGKWSPWGRFLWLKSQVDQLLIDEIEERRQKGILDGDDILTLLMLARDENGEEIQKIINLIPVENLFLLKDWLRRL